MAPIFRPSFAGSPFSAGRVSETCSLSSGTETLYTATLRLSHREAATWALFRYYPVGSDGSSIARNSSQTNSTL